MFPDRAALDAWRQDWRTILALLQESRPEQAIPLMTSGERSHVLDAVRDARDYLADVEATVRRMSLTAGSAVGQQAPEDGS